MKKIYLLFILLFLVGCGKNFNQEGYYNYLVTDKGFSPTLHPQGMKYLIKGDLDAENSDFLIIPTGSGNIDKNFDYNLKILSIAGYKIILEEKTYVEMINNLGMRVFMYKDQDCLIVTSGNSSDYFHIVLDLKN